MELYTDTTAPAATAPARRGLRPRLARICPPPPTPPSLHLPHELLLVRQLAGAVAGGCTSPGNSRAARAHDSADSLNQASRD